MKNLQFKNRIRIPLILLLLTLLFNINVKAQKVLIAGATSETSRLVDVQTKINSTGFFTSVDYVDISTGTPTLAFLQQYNAVLVFTDASAADATTLGNNLASYIDDGGGVVDAVFENASLKLLGNFNTPLYRCLNPLNQTQYTRVTLGTILLPDHPTMNGVTSFDGGSSSYRSTSTSITPTSYLIANYSSGEILVAAREDAGLSSTKRVSLNFYPPSSDARNDFWDTSTDGALLMANSLMWVSSAPAVPIPVGVIALLFGLLFISIIVRRRFFI